MSDSNASDLRTILSDLEERLYLFHSILERKLDDLIYKEEASQLWKAGVESAIHTMWDKMCSQRDCTSVSCQTNEQLEEDHHTSQESSTYVNDDSAILQEEENYILCCAEKDSDNSYREETGTLRESSTLLNKTGENSFTVDNKDNTQRRSKRRAKQTGVKIAASSLSSSHSIVRDAHKKQRPKKLIYHSCTHCAAKFTLKSELVVHERIHADTKCGICSRVFTKPSDLRIHSRLHTGKFPFECTKCWKSYATKKQLRRHNMYHMEPKHACFHCGKAFYYPTQLASHVASHSIKKPVTCPICRKGYCNQYVLNSHVRMQHPGECK